MTIKLAWAGLLAACAATACADGDRHHHRDRDDDRGRQQHQERGHDHERHARINVELGPRPHYLVDGMSKSALKRELLSCRNDEPRKSDFSIGHRGAPMQFPEHTKESYEAAARMGAGIIECDVTFTSDGELVCRHAECDLHTTTNIVATELNAKCSVPWTGPGSSPKCCASDLTLAEFRTLTGKMDAANPAATTAEGYLGGTANWRTDVYTGRGTLVTHAESIRLIKRLGAKFTPELKGGDPARIAEVFGSQEAYAQKLVDEYKAAGIPARDVWAQSFNVDDVLYWIEHEPRFGRQAVYLDSIDPTASPAVPGLTFGELRAVADAGVNIFAPPMWALLSVRNGKVVPSDYAREIKRAGLDIITWTFERANLTRGAAQGGWYYQFDPTGAAIETDGDMYEALDVLSRRVGILGIFSDWPATVTYYANCTGRD
ncbi:MAG: glycerophosphodiester phosphodiesterase family protein [Gammaproteobacteria bacterium]